MATGSVCQAAGLMLGLALASSMARGQAVVYSTGFEGPQFSAGSLLGQDQWQNDPPTANSAFVQGAVVSAGSQAARFDAAALTPGTTWFYRPLNYVVGVPNRFVRISWDMRISSAASPSSSWGVEVFDPSIVARFALCFVSNATGTFFVFNTAAQNSINSGIVIPKDAWRHYEVVLDFQAKTSSFFVEGTPAAQNIQWDADVFPPSNTIADADFRCTTPGNDSCFVDNFQVIAVPAPCPGDADGNRMVNFDDVSAVLAGWGGSPVLPNTAGDSNGDGVVDFDDITDTLANWLGSCP